MSDAAIASAVPVHRLGPVVYVPPRHAAAPLPRADADADAIPRSICRPPAFVSAGARSAFTAVHPRWAQGPPNSGPPPWATPPPFLPKLASIQQSYTKLIARNELLKLLVAKQLKQLYEQNAGRIADWQRRCGPEHVTTTVPADRSAVAAVAVQQRSSPPIQQHHWQRLLELSTVIKTINAKAATAVSSSSSWSQTTRDAAAGKVAARLMQPTAGDVGGPQFVFKCEWIDCRR